MTLFLSLFASAAIQVVVVGAVPLVWWLVTARRTTPLLTWLGLVRPRIDRPARFVVASIAMFVAFAALAASAQALLRGVPNLAASQFAGRGWAALPAILVYGWVQTSMMEEVFFRGFLLGRLEHRFGFWIGNLVQGVVFGLLHVGLLVSAAVPVGTVAVVVEFLLPAVIGWGFGWIRREAGGSIVPTWILHGFANTLAPLVAALAS